jgi:hypothetical protein
MVWDGRGALVARSPVGVEDKIDGEEVFRRAARVRPFRSLHHRFARCLATSFAFFAAPAPWGWSRWWSVQLWFAVSSRGSRRKSEPLGLVSAVESPTCQR